MASLLFSLMRRSDGGLRKIMSGANTQYLYDGCNSLQELSGRVNPIVTAKLPTVLAIEVARR